MTEDGFYIDDPDDEMSYAGDAYRECEVGEDALREGGRCTTYIVWLTAMHRERERFEKKEGSA